MSLLVYSNHHTCRTGGIIARAREAATKDYETGDTQAILKRLDDVHSEVIKYQKSTEELTEGVVSLQKGQENIREDVKQLLNHIKSNPGSGKLEEKIDAMNDMIHSLRSDYQTIRDQLRQFCDPKGVTQQVVDNEQFDGDAASILQQFEGFGNESQETDGGFKDITIVTGEHAATDFEKSFTSLLVPVDEVQIVDVSHISHVSVAQSNLDMTEPDSTADIQPVVTKETSMQEGLESKKSLDEEADDDLIDVRQPSLPIDPAKETELTKGLEDERHGANVRSGKIFIGPEYFHSSNIQIVSSLPNAPEDGSVF